MPLLRNSDKHPIWHYTQAEYERDVLHEPSRQTLSRRRGFTTPGYYWHNPDRYEYVGPFETLETCNAAIRHWSSK